MKLLKSKPTEEAKIRKFGVYNVCFDEKFCIGHGSNGTKVYVGLSDDGYEVAIKVIKHVEEPNRQQMGNIEKEILNLPKVQYEKHIINYRFYGIIDPTTACLVLDLHEENLQDYVIAKERPIEQLRKEGQSIICQILYGVRALHRNSPEILHRDLKPSNVLVNVEGQMVLADFGLSRLLPEDQSSCKSGMSGTEGWMAVESLPTENDDDDNLSYADIQVRYRKPSDIQVIGMLCYFILTKGKHPYGKRLRRNSNISDGKFYLSDLSDPCAKDLITWMLEHDYSKRPNVYECLKHPYLRTAEENFNFVTRVGNEKEIKNKDLTSIVVQELNKVHSFINWLTTIDTCVVSYMTPAWRPAYTNDAADLLRFTRNMAAHWDDKVPPANVQNTVVRPQEYFERKFPTLPVEVHRIIRRHPDWTTRENLKDFFIYSP